jgi:ABC-type sugar transport system permease subunit
MDLILEIWLAFTSIAFLIETCILIGRYLDVETISKTKIKVVLYFLFLAIIISIISGILGGLIYKNFEHNVFNLTIIFVVWIPIFYPIYYSIYKFDTLKTKPIKYLKCENFQKITPENSIIINHILDRDRRLFSDIDALDTKIAQIIALNGVIISLVFLGTATINANNLTFLGLSIIICSMIIGVWSFYPRVYFAGPPNSFYKNYRENESVSELISKLLFHYPQNLKTHNQKGDLFRYLLVSLIFGLIILVVSLVMQPL